jgi:MoaA/NifB/PqqE/SkfB family radical SAM enzyme
MLKSKKTEVAHVEFTSRCNLRCVFCCVSQTHYLGVDLPGELLKQVIEDLKRRKITIVCVSGHGETTLYKDWHLYCNDLIRSGISLHIISNFAKKFSEDELETLSKFKSIEISCDTVDPELFGKIRRGARFGNLMTNLENLKATGKKNKRKMPTISFSCVVSDLNIFGLKNYVDFAIKHGIKCFNFCNLTKYPDIDGGINANHISEMPLDDMKKAYSILTDTFAFLEKSRIEYKCQKGLIDTLKEELQMFSPDSTHDETCAIQPPLEETQKCEESNAHKYSSRRGEFQTRDCLDPWSFFLIKSDRDVLPCCWHPPIGTITEGKSLEEILNNTSIQILRKRLLTGDLPLDCIQCPSKGWTSTGELKKRVTKYLYDKQLGKLFHRKIPSVEIPHKQPYEIVYLAGFHDLEENLDIKDSDWQTWRWTERDATFCIDNPFTPGTFLVRGSINKMRFPDQNVIIKINGKIIDKFMPYNDRFYKKYEIGTQMMGNSSRVNVSIHTNRTFNPSKCEPGSNDNRELGLQIYEIYFGKRV